MPIKIVSKDELDEFKLNGEIQKIQKIEGEVVVAIKSAIDYFVMQESLLELRDYIDDAIYNWEDKELELVDDDDEDYDEDYEDDDEDGEEEDEED